MERALVLGTGAALEARAGRYTVNVEPVPGTLET
jgi:hypothetical protein